jgi:hypothetical protein
VLKELEMILKDPFFYSYQKISELKNIVQLKGEILYRGSRDGFRNFDFHSRCDYKTNQLTILEGYVHLMLIIWHVLETSLSNLLKEIMNLKQFLESLTLLVIWTEIHLYLIGLGIKA